MIERLSEKELRKRLLINPAVGLIGPRQCGKTTLARALGGQYFDLEQEGDRLRLDLMWGEVIRGNELVILDEAQSAPEVFSRLRGAIDSDRGRCGRFLVLGSVAPSLMVKVSESLAGRLGLMELTPFVMQEVGVERERALWLDGGFPGGGVLERGRFPRWQMDYLTLLAQRDLPTWGLTAKPQVISRFMRMVAALNSQNWNATQLGTALGLDYKTVNSYLDFLEGAFLVRRLAPYQANIGKRLVKTPKVYWRDSGLLHAMLNVSDETALLNQPWVGGSWEGFVIEQVLNTLTARGKVFESYFFRTSDQHEIDLVLEMDGERTAIEIKLTSSPSPADMAKLDKAATMIEARRRFLVSNTEVESGDGDRMSCNLGGLLRSLGGAK